MNFRIPKGRLARSSLQTGGLLGLRVLTQAAVLVLLTHLLGPQAYGSFAAAASLAVVMGILPNLGAGYILMARAAHDVDAASDTWRYAWPLTALLGVLLLAVYLLAARQSSGDTLSWQILLWLGATELLITPFVILLSFALQASERVPLSQFVQWLPMGLRAIAVLPCFAMADAEGLHGYVVLQAVAALAGLGIGLAITQRHVRLDWRPRTASISELKNGATYAAMHMVAANPSELDKVMALRLVGTHDAGIYAATTRAMGAVAMPVIAMLLAAQPRLFRHAHQPNEQGHRLIQTIAALALAWGLLCWLLLTLCSPILPWLFGVRFTAMAELMPWLSAVAAPLSLRFAAGTVLVAFGRPLERVCFELCGIAVLVGAMLLLAPHLGTRGLAMALFASESSMALTGWWLVHRHLRQRTPAPVTPGPLH